MKLKEYSLNTDVFYQLYDVVMKYDMKGEPIYDNILCFDSIDIGKRIMKDSSKIKIYCCEKDL